MKVFEKKRSMKIRLRLGLKIFKQTEEFDGQMDTTVKEIALTVPTPQRITKHNFKSVLETQKGIIEDKMDRINEIVGGSGWQVKKYTKLAIDIFETKPLRASSYIPTPERYSNPKCGLINIHNTDQECFRWCMKIPPECQESELLQDNGSEQDQGQIQLRGHGVPCRPMMPSRSSST
jgi:hypothetical protein